LRNNIGLVGGNLSPSITMLTSPNTNLEWEFNPSAHINTHVARGFHANTNQSPNHYNNKFTTHVHKWPNSESVFIETKTISFNYIEEQNTRKALASNIFRRRQSDSVITEERCSYIAYRIQHYVYYIINFIYATAFEHCIRLLVITWYIKKTSIYLDKRYFYQHDICGYSNLNVNISDTHKIWKTTIFSRQCWIRVQPNSRINAKITIYSMRIVLVRISCLNQIVCVQKLSQIEVSIYAFYFDTF